MHPLIVSRMSFKVTTFTGNYSAYSEKKAMLRKAAYQAYLNQQQEIKHQEEVIAKLRQFNREKSIRRAESREKMLEKMDVLEKPVEVDASMKITLRPRITSGNDVLTVEHLTKSFPSLPLFEDLNFTVKRGEKVAIIGNNGTGKTTILKILNQLLVPDSGVFHLGENRIRGNLRRLPEADQYGNPQSSCRLFVYGR